MHLHAFIAILVPKLVAVVTPLCPLCTGVSQMNSLIAQTLFQNQPLHGYDAYNWSCGYFCDIFAYFGQKLVAMATSIRPYNQKCLLWIARPRKPPVISNHILIISRTNAFTCIYSNFSPKIACHGKPFCPLCMGVSQMNSPIAQTLSQNQTLYQYDAYNWSCGHFCDIFAYFGQNLFAVTTSLRPLQSEMSSLDWSTRKTPCYK